MTPAASSPTLPVRHWYSFEWTELREDVKNVASAAKPIFSAACMGILVVSAVSLGTMFVLFAPVGVGCLAGGAVSWLLGLSGTAALIAKVAASVAAYVAAIGLFLAIPPAAEASPPAAAPTPAALPGGAAAPLRGTAGSSVAAGLQKAFPHQ